MLNERKTRKKGNKNAAASRIAALQELMIERNISVYIVPTADFHGSEYVSEYFKERMFLTGFTGSAGTAVVTREEAGLWTDGRYYIQAEKQLAGSGITLYRAGMDGVPKVSEFVKEKLKEGTALGFDGRTMTAADGKKYLKLAEEKGCLIKSDEDLVDLIWKDRPDFPIHSAFVLEEQYAGESAQSKIARIREVMEKEGADVHILSCLYDIAWVLNVRGDDIPCVPVVMSYLLIGKERCIWYVSPGIFDEKPNSFQSADESHAGFMIGISQEEKETAADQEKGETGRKAYGKHPEFRRGRELKNYLDEIGVEIRYYAAFYDDLKNLEELLSKDGSKDVKKEPESGYGEAAVKKTGEAVKKAAVFVGKTEAEAEKIGEEQEKNDSLNVMPEQEKNTFLTVMLEKGKVNLQILNSFPESTRVIDRVNPEERMKAIKNPVEIANIRNAHVKDGVAVTKFIYWLKKHIGKEKITEWSAADVLEQFRSEQEGFLDISFDTISAYGPNAAMMHYAPSKEHEVVLEQKGFLLVDSGGHYLEGSTDITRNIVLGELTEEEKQMFTAVLRGCLNLANAKFLYGCCGQNLDILARGPLWQQELDYRCGTGHGNGYLLNVHEGPNGFRWRIVPERRDDGVLEDGMVTTDEPGVYVEGKYGIRIENELLCKKAEKNEYGQFMEFENITYAPIDLDAVLPEEMTAIERGYLNEYHKKVYETVAPFLTEEEREWLAYNTREI